MKDKKVDRYKVEKLTPMQSEIRNEISRTFDRLGAERGVFAAIHSWGDTMPEKDILQMLKDMNKLMKEKEVLDKVTKMGIESLSPEMFEKLEIVLFWLKKNRHIEKK